MSGESKIVGRRLKTPVGFFVFNRPESTEKVLQEILKANPPVVYVVADGPRAGNQSDMENCKKVRELVKQASWNCDVVYHFSETNMGCKRRVSSGLSWLFEQTEEAIILEDDCLPNPSFFGFCEEMLEKYRDDTRIMHVAGLNMQLGQEWGEGSYYFSNYNPIWGWATWRRAWKHYDVEMKTLPLFLEQNQIANIISSREIQKSWTTNFQAVRDGEIDTWDFQWTYAIWTQGGLSIIPNVNLVSNIGFSPDSLHTKDVNSKFSNLPTQAMGEISHPQFVIPCREADEFIDKSFVLEAFSNKVKRRLLKILRT